MQDSAVGFLATVRAHMSKGDLDKTEETLIGSGGFWESGRLAYFVTTKLDLDSDGGSNPSIRWDDTHQPETSLRDVSGKSLDALTVPFVVAPGGGWRKKHNIDLGDFCLLEHGGKLVPCVFGDVGPERKIGEASVYVHELLGFDRTQNGRIVDIGLGGTTRFLVFKDSANAKNGKPYCPANAEITRKVWALYNALK